MTEKNKIIDTGKSKELLEAEKEVEQETVDLPEADKDIICEDAADENEAQQIIDEEVKSIKRKKAMQIAKTKVNKETPSRALANRPSSGFNHAVIEMHMRDAYGIAMGRSKESGAPITGLYAAAKQANFLTTSYKRGCLFAAKILIDIENEMNDIFEKMNLRKIENKNYLDGVSLMKLEPFNSAVPTKIDLSFVSPYAYHYTELLLQYDEMVRKIFPYFSIRKIDRKDFKNRTNPTARDLRRLLAMGSRYFFVGPQSFEKKDLMYQQAVQIWGELNEDIVTRKVRPNLVALPERFI